MYSRDSVVAVQSFVRRQEGEDIIIGRPETAVFLAVPPAAVEVLDQLAQGKSIGETADLFQRKYGEPLDMDDFLSLLEREGIVQGEPGIVANDHTNRAIAAYHFSDFPSSWAQRIFSRPVLSGSFFIIVLAAAIVACRPSFMVGPRDLYFPDHRAFSWTILAAAAYLTLFFHEFAHLLAAKALGINSRIGIGHRLWYLVAETDLTALWSVPKQKRYLPLLAGPLLDLLSAALLILLRFLAEEGWFSVPLLGTRLLRAMAFVYLARIAGQCFLFIRTDFYYVIANFFDCKNLLGDTENYLRNRLAKIVRRIHPVDQSAIPESEQKVIHVYAWVWVTGRIAAVLMLIAITVPLAIRYAKNLAGAFRTGYSANPTDFVDAILLAIYFFIPVTLGIILWIGGMARREGT